MTYIVNIRERRQITLPAEVFEQLALSVGDKLAFQIEKGKLIAKPVRQQAIDTLKAIQKAFEKITVSEKEFLKNGQELRKKLAKKLYG